MEYDDYSGAEILPPGILANLKRPGKFDDSWFCPVSKDKVANFSTATKFDILNRTLHYPPNNHAPKGTKIKVDKSYMRMALFTWEEAGKLKR